MKNSNRKANPVYEQMKRCFQELDLPIHSEKMVKGELGIHSKLDVMDVCAGLTILYNVKTGVISVYALQLGLNEFEWNAVHNHYIDILHDEFEEVEACDCPGTTVVGCAATISLKDGTLDVQYFRKVLRETVKVSRSISWYVCGFRIGRERALKRMLGENLN